MATQETKSMVSEVSICNQAMSLVKANTIVSLDDNSEEARWCDENYQFVRDAVIEEAMWTFATVRHVSTTADMEAFGVQYAHPLPSGWLDVFRVYRDISGSDPSSWCKSEGWRKEGNNVLADQGTVYLWGVQRVTDAGRFSNLFVQALAQRLAAMAAIPLRGDKSMSVTYWQLYDGMINMAKTRDGQQGSNERIRSSSLVDARHGGYSGR